MSVLQPLTPPTIYLNKKKEPGSDRKWTHRCSIRNTHSHPFGKYFTTKGFGVFM